MERSTVASGLGDAADAAPRTTLGESFFIVPAAHTAIVNGAFQTEMYALFHRTTVGRAGHMLGTPATLLGAAALLERATGASWPGAGLMVFVALWGTIIDRVAAAITAALGLGLVALVHVASPSLSVALALVFGGCFVQTFSHLAEDVPPPQSGSSGFVPFGEWFKGTNVRELVRSTLLTFGVFYWLELWATLRIWPIQILNVLLWLGYRPAERARLDARVADIVAHPQSGWRRPAPDR